MWNENVNGMKCVRSECSVGKERVRVRGVCRTQYGKAVGGVRIPCVAKVKILSIPDGAHREEMGRSCGRWRGAERTSQSGVSISGRNIETNHTHI